MRLLNNLVLVWVPSLITDLLCGFEQSLRFGGVFFFHIQNKDIDTGYYMK